MKIYQKLPLLFVFMLIAGGLSLLPGVMDLSPAFAQSDPDVASTSGEIGMISTDEPQPWVDQAPEAPPYAAIDASSPGEFAAGINPLTGLLVEDASLLDLPPALISVTNFPVSARPQAGLSFAPFVYELYIGEGMTRFLAVFYGDYPQAAVQGEDTSVMTNNKAEIGPVRSGRLPYQAIRKLYNGFLVMASADSQVGMSLSNATNFFGSDSDDINSALLDVSRLQAIAEANASAEPANLTGNTFDAAAPKGGQGADQLWVFYNYLNQAMWTFDPASGAYLRAQDQADGSGEFSPATDRLTGEQLAFENVIVLNAQHQVLNSAGTMIDVDLLYRTGKAYLFRDGNMYPILWSTVNGEYEKATGKLRPIRFTDMDGEPISLKPGSTWVEVMDVTATLKETAPGAWKARFYSP